MILWSKIVLTASRPLVDIDSLPERSRKTQINGTTGLGEHGEYFYVRGYMFTRGWGYNLSLF